MSDLDETMPSTERPGAEPKVKTPAELRYEGMSELLNSVAARTGALGEGLAWLQMDVDQLRDEVRAHRDETAANRKDTEAVLEAVRYLTTVVTKIREHQQRETPQNSPPSANGDHISEQ